MSPVLLFSGNNHWAKIQPFAFAKPPHETAFPVSMIPDVKKEGLCGVLGQKRTFHLAQTPCH